ncbi:hypothetical protein CA983_12440 [Streptomyces swartbergensis]|uniref:Uncharacterized protein n=1 Tax=Streptomyces swartbergensis TaxID=487165 RepID=A0A243S5U3_9ACTN|nr:hypothetical protein CA983_12440 [Streptomyces swartbergensis]
MSGVRLARDHALRALLGVTTTVVPMEVPYRRMVCQFSDPHDALTTTCASFGKRTFSSSAA